MSLVEQIRYYFEKRGLNFPNFQNAMKWVQTELGEVYEQDLARSGNWVRNNPSDHDSFSKNRLAEELADTLFMILVAGMSEDIDLVDVMLSKMARKLSELEERKIITGNSVALPVTEKEIEEMNGS